MRNLLVVEDQLLEHATLPPCSLRATIDSPSQVLYAPVTTLDDRRALARYDLTHNNNHRIVVFPNANEHPDFPESDQELGSVVSVGYMPDHEAVCVVFGNGFVVLVHQMDHGSDVKSEDLEFEDRVRSQDELVEVVGVIQGGKICAAGLSPDSELIAIATDANTILLMSKDWDILEEIDVHSSEDFDAVVPRRITWRGDGQYFACYFDVRFESGDVESYLNVWDRNGVSEAKSCPLSIHSANAQNLLAWRPSGDLIAAINCSTAQKVQFFEKNTLEHGEMKIPYDALFGIDQKSEFIFLEWNADSDLLALASTDSLCIFYRGNYHWYLKQQLKFSPEHGKINSIVWDPEKSMRLAMISTSGVIRSVTFGWDVSSSMFSDATVGVVDGSSLLITPFSKCVVPPPMSFSQISLGSESSCIIAASFCFEELDFSLVALLESSNTGYSVCVYDTQSLELIKKIPLLSITGPAYFRHVLFISRERIVLVQRVSESKEKIWLLKTSDPSSMDSYLLDEICVFAITYSPIMNDLIIQSSTGSVALLSLANAEFQLKDSGILFPLPCEKISAVRWMSPEGRFEQALVGLSALPSRRLSVANFSDKSITIVSQQCSSFIASFSSDFLLFTNSGPQNVLLLLDKRQQLSKLLTMDLSQNSNALRLVEKGSRLVSVAGLSTVVLQMPRGNLEAIYPRALVLESVKVALAKKNYLWSLKELRKNRMDLNLLYDLNPEGFMQDLDVFVKQIHNVDLINLFLSSLKDNAGDGRINKICDAIREKIILLGDSNRFILSVICSYVRKSPSDIESALRHISKLSETDDDEAANANDLESQSSALKYLLCLVDDIEELFSCALGLYDLKLTALIGRNSQKDPREYLPFLQKADELGKSNVWLQKHFIDMHLKRFDKALINLSNAGEEHFEKCLNLIEEYKLYKQGLHIYLKDKDQRKWKIVMLSYGSFLLNEVKNYSHAAQVFTAAGDLERAFEAHMKCNEWKQALCIAGELGRDSQSVAYDVVEGLKAAPTSQNLASAARILLDYFADNEVDEAVALLCRSNNFFEALRICHVFQRDDLIATVYKPAIISAYTSMSQDLTKRHSRFNYCSNRLRTIRSEKKKNLGDDADFEKEDLVSEAGSTLSVFTLSSQSSITSTMARSWSTASLLLGKGDSSRSSELHEMRKARKTKMKEGHPKEEAFLLKELKSLAPKQTLCNESQVLIESLMHSKELGKAASYHKQLKEFLDEVASQESNAMPYGDWPSEIYENGSDLGKLKFDWIDFLETITSESVDASNSANENLENKTNESDDIGFGLGLF